MDLPPPHHIHVVTLAPPAHIPILPSSPLAIVFIGMLAVMIFITDKHLGLVDFSHSGLEGNTTFIHTVHDTCFCGIMTNELERM
jgi:hypothetical protein